jgi:uncharacterized DUF497 family protein
MEFEWDEAKYRTNLEKHRIRFELVYKLDWHRMKARVDDRFDYGEERFVGYAPAGDDWYVVIFVIRPVAYRIISLRKFGRKDHLHYAALKD